MSIKYVIGIDGGASKTQGVIFDSLGKTIAYQTTLGANLTIDEIGASNRVVNLITDLLNKSKLQFDQVSAVGIALAGASNEVGRERLFGLLDNLKISDKTIITSDVESVYNFIWGQREGILINVGTGVSCIGKKKNNFIRVAGKGHDNGDIGSGYWIGKEAMIEMGLKQSTLNPDIDKIILSALNHFKAQNYNDLVQEINASEDRIPMIASFAKPIISMAEKNNEVAIGIVQEATRVIGDYIIELKDILKYGNKDIIIAANGSIIRNNYFRSELNNALSFEFSNIKWLFLDISPAYTSGYLCAGLKGIEINKKDIATKGASIKS